MKKVSYNRYADVKVLVVMSSRKINRQTTDKFASLEEFEYVSLLFAAS